MDITEKIQKEIAIYCKANGIDDVNGFLNGLVVKAFNIEKYGATPNYPSDKLIKAVKEPKPKVVKVKPISLTVSYPLEDLIEAHAKEAEALKDALKIDKKKLDLYDEN
jgi:hypothetical protein